jgi:hypothetical protein
MTDTPGSVRIRTGDRHAGRFTILDETTDRWPTDARGKAIVRTCESERLLRQAVVRAVERADTDGPLRADQLADILSTRMFTVSYDTTIDTNTD